MTHEFTVEDCWFEWSAESYAITVLKGLHLQCLSQQFCDVTLTVGSKHYPANKAVLSAASPYFNAMFSINMAELDKTNVVIHGVSPDIFQLLFDFIYTGRYICINFQKHLDLEVLKNLKKLYISV